MKIGIKIFAIVLLITTVILYLATSFIYLDFTLSWLYDFAVESASNRSCIVAAFIVKIYTDILISAAILDENDVKKINL